MGLQRVGFVAIVFSPEARAVLPEQTGLIVFPVCSEPVEVHGLIFQYVRNDVKWPDYPEGVVVVSNASDGSERFVLTTEAKRIVDEMTIWCDPDFAILQREAIKIWMEKRDIESGDIFQVPIEFRPKY